MTNPHHFYFVDNDIKYHVRPIEPADRVILQKGFKQLSDWSKHLRFFNVRSELNSSQLDFFTKVDGVSHVSWIIIDETNNEHNPVGVGRLVKLKNEPKIAEIAITVVDDYQKKGMGKILFSVLNVMATHNQIEKLRCYVISDNNFVLKVLDKFGVISRKKEGQISIIDTDVIKNNSVISDIKEMKEFMAVFSDIKTNMEND